MAESEKVIDIGGQEYRLSDLSTEVKELLLLHSQAQEMMIEARRKAAIHELAAVSLASLIKGRVDASANKPSAVPTDDTGR